MMGSCCILALLLHANVVNYNEKNFNGYFFQSRFQWASLLNSVRTQTGLRGRSHIMSATEGGVSQPISDFSDKGGGGLANF